MKRYSVLGYYKDVLVGAISCRFESEKTYLEESGGVEEMTMASAAGSEAGADGKSINKVVYIMTINVLQPYRRYQIGSQLLEKAIEDCTKDDISKIYLHVLCSNHSAIEFYKNNGFTIKKKLENYYTDLNPPDCYIFEKDLEEYKK